MKPRLLQALLLAASLGAAPATAQCVTDRHGNVLCPPPDSRCLQNLHGDWWCAPSGGDVVLDRARQAVCGPGQCQTDLRGDVKCSSQPRGSSALDRYREVQCTGACVAASAAACVRPR